MASKGSLNLIELHIEKVLLGLAVAFTAAVAVYYLIGPNEVEYKGHKLGPRELDEAILADAQDLQRDVRNASAEVPRVPEYAKQLRERFDVGFLAAQTGGGPALPGQLPVAAAFGKALPTFEDQEEADDIVLVKPLPPRSLAARTGISLVRRTQAALEDETPGAEEPEEEPPVALSWVTIGGYYPMEAQRREMTKNGYAGYRAKVYLTGVEVQRQELLDSGEFSDWMDVKPSLAMPQVKIPEPSFDDKAGDVLNQDQLDAALNLVRSSQQALIEPDFYFVEAGDEWLIPPLSGLEDEEEEEEEIEIERPKRREPRPTPQPVRRPAPTGGGRGGFTGGRGAPGVGGGEGGRGAPPGAGYGGGQSEAKRKAEARKQIVKDLREAERAYKAEDYTRAQQLAQGVADDPDANAGHRRKAQVLLARIKKAVEKQQRAMGGGGPGGMTSGRGAPPGVVVMPGGRGAPPGGVPGPSFAGGGQQPGVLITNPEKDEEEREYAVWFHDDSVEPGKNYRYRMRVKLWNRYVGRRANLRDPQQAAQPVLVGEWSLPSDPISVAPRRHFFVKGPRFGEPAAIVEVFTWHKGNWLRESFNVRVGDVIGDVRKVKTGEDDDFKPIREDVDFSTGAIVLDLRLDDSVLYRQSGKKGEFSYRETRSLVLIYLDPADGQVKERIAAMDRSDRTYRKLKQESEEG